MQIVLHPETAKVKWLADQPGIDGIEGGLAESWKAVHDEWQG
ncbi:hypothetical protein [Granulicella sp. L46]|nr:hypothetical protein [Granulicella sp. L46]